MTDTAALRQLSARLVQDVRPARLGVAVSGGGDSMALLDLMAWHAEQSGFSVEAVTVDHRLRTGSAEEAAQVADHCAARGIAHETLRWNGWDGRGNLQAGARRARYALIGAWAVRRGIDCVALGHTLDDQAETFLLRLRRASGVDGLSRMAPRFSGDGTTWIRPLLEASRAALRGHLRASGIDWVEDPSNDDDRFERVRARRILAALRPLGIGADTVATVSAHMTAARAALDHYTAAEAPRLVRTDRGDAILDRDPAPPVPAEIARRILAAALRWVSGAGWPPRMSALSGIETAMEGAGIHAAAGCIVTRDGSHHWRVTREWNAVRNLACPTDALWDDRWRLSGPHAPGLSIRALGAAVTDCPAWRETGLPRRSLMASPAVWRGKTLVAAPLAGLARGWSADLAETRRDFPAAPLLR